MPAQTAKTPGNGSGTLSYTLASDSFDIESVYVSVDATVATGPVTAELTVRDQSGVVIARKKQAATIPAGTAGSATWALRLDDEAAASGGGGIQFDTDNQGGYLQVTTHAAVPSTGRGIDFRSDDPIRFQVDGGGGNADLSSYGGGDVNLFADQGSINIGTTTGLVSIVVAPSGNGVLIDNNSEGDTVITGDGVTTNVEIRAASWLKLRGTESVRMATPDFRVTGLDNFVALRTTDGPAIGFLGAAPVTQAATPATLADVIAILQAVGLCA